MDTKILETRLLLRESVFGIVNVSRCATKFKNLNDSIRMFELASSKENVEVKDKNLDEYKTNIDTASDAYLRDIMQFEFEVIRMKNLLDAFDNEIIAYSSTEKDVEEEIAQAEDAIKSLQLKLREDNFLRRHKEKLESFAEKINSFPTKSQLKTEIADKTAELNRVSDTITSTEENINIRFSQYKELLYYLSSLEEDLINPPLKSRESIGMDLENSQVDSSATEDSYELPIEEERSFDHSEYIDDEINVE